MLDKPDFHITFDASKMSKHCHAYATDSAFHVVRCVPTENWNSVAWNGYHFIPLHESDKHLTFCPICSETG